MTISFVEVEEISHILDIKKNKNQTIFDKFWHEIGAGSVF